jgi:hypothetical protein
MYFIICSTLYLVSNHGLDILKYQSRQGLYSTARAGQRITENPYLRIHPNDSLHSPSSGKKRVRRSLSYLFFLDFLPDRLQSLVKDQHSATTGVVLCCVVLCFVGVRYSCRIRIRSSLLVPSVPPKMEKAARAVVDGMTRKVV